MFEDKYYNKQHNINAVPIPQFLTGLGISPIYYGEDPGHVADDLNQNDIIDKLSR